jgi:hypothetical protein
MRTRRTEYCATRFTPQEKDRLYSAAKLLGLNAAELTRLAIREALRTLLRKLPAVARIFFARHVENASSWRADNNEKPG